MAFMRGRYYLWSDATHLHVWADDGYDQWDQSVWAAAIDGGDLPRESDPSGACVPIDVLDEFVVMRLAQMLDEGVTAPAIRRALLQHRGNGGCFALVAHAEKLLAALPQASK
jgi:hypothetical protein